MIPRWAVTLHHVTRHHQFVPQTPARSLPNWLTYSGLRIQARPIIIKNTPIIWHWFCFENKWNRQKNFCKLLRLFLCVFRGSCCFHLVLWVLSTCGILGFLYQFNFQDCLVNLKIYPEKRFQPCLFSSKTLFIGLKQSSKAVKESDYSDDHPSLTICYACQIWNNMSFRHAGPRHLGPLSQRESYNRNLSWSLSSPKSKYVHLQNKGFALKDFGQ